MRKKIFIFEGDLTAKSVYDSLDSQDKELLNKFKDYLLISASEKRTEEAIREIIRLRIVTGKSLNEINLEDLHYFLKELQTYNFADFTKNKIKDFVHRFLRWAYKDWSERFNEFLDIKMNTNAQNKKPITSKTIFSQEDIKKLLDTEPTLYWKTFLMTQYEGALRTGEVRTLLWERVNIGDDGLTTLEISSKKNKNGTSKIKPVIVKIAGRFLKKLKEEQDKYGIKSKYVFPSPHDVNKPISKAVNLWFNKLTKKALGRSANNYLLRHSRGTELEKKVREGQMSKDNALEFMRHSEKMFDKVYSHMDTEDIKQLMKKQIYNTKSLTSEQKDRLTILEQQIKKINALLKSDLIDIDTGGIIIRKTK